jgi:hypothetical protein
MISLTHNFAFIHVNKTGGTSVCEALADYEDIQTEARDHDPAEIYRARLGKALWDEMFSFAFLRNPWDRMVSSYEYRRQYNVGLHETSFKEWLLGPVQDNPLDREWSNQLWMVKDAGGDIIVKELYLYERLSEGFSKARSRIGIATPELGTYNKTVREAWDGYYDRQTAELVRTRFADDLKWAEVHHPGVWERPTAIGKKRGRRRRTPKP